MAQDTADATNEPAASKRSKKMLIPIVVLALGLGGGGYFFMAGSSAQAAPKTGASTTSTTTALGPIVRLEPTTLNLSDGHYLRVGIALQLVKKPKDKDLATAAAGGGGGEGAKKVDPASPLSGEEAKALDIAIAELGDMTADQLEAPNARLVARDALTKKLNEVYGGDIVQVYFTDFVMT
jgi:flagellar protein FliL